MEKQQYTFSTPADSPPLETDVHFSQSQVGCAPLPVAILFHPGGFVVGGKDIISKGVVEYLVQELGVVAVVPNYRLCPAVSVWEGPVTDGKACLEWVRKTLPGQLKTHAQVSIDVEQIATIGFSAGGTIALLLVCYISWFGFDADKANNTGTQAAESPKPKACLTLYGELYWNDPVWSQPKAALARLPVIAMEEYSQVYDEGIVVAAPSTKGPTGPDLSKPRNAWLLTSIKEGWWLSEIVKDGDYSRIDPANLFGVDFPATGFVHGTADVVCPFSMSERAHLALKSHGVATALFPAPEKGHDFDATLMKDDLDFMPVREGLKWLKAQLDF